MRIAVLAFVLALSPLPVLAQEAVEAADSASVAVKKVPEAEARSDSLDRLFARLHKAGPEGDAQRIEQKIWELWSSSDSPTAEVLLHQASKAMDEGAPEESLKILDKLVAAYPEFPEAWNKRATLYFLMKRYDASLADIDKVLDLEPRHFGALAGRGMIYQRQKKYSLAAEAFEEALHINPGMEAAKAALDELRKQEQGI